MDLERIDDFNCLAIRQKCQSCIHTYGAFSNNLQFVGVFAFGALIEL
jgi:hypothetical protein